jgi:hypothetical protein
MDRAEARVPRVHPAVPAQPDMDRPVPQEARPLRAAWKAVVDRAALQKSRVAAVPPVHPVCRAADNLVRLLDTDLQLT